VHVCLGGRVVKQRTSELPPSLWLISNDRVHVHKMHPHVLLEAMG